MVFDVGAAAVGAAEGADMDEDGTPRAQDNVLLTAVAPDPDVPGSVKPGAT